MSLIISVFSSFPQFLPGEPENMIQQDRNKKPLELRKTPALDRVAPLETGLIGDRIRTGLVILLKAHRYANDSDAKAWDFALEIGELYNSGLTISDLRWLVAKGLADHACEISQYGERHRRFQPGDGFRFNAKTCFVLTPRGVTVACHLAVQTEHSGLADFPVNQFNGGDTMVLPDTSAIASENTLATTEKPGWNPDLRELWLGNRIVKRFRVPARNQQTILSAFEEEGWPGHIDDPLPVSGDIDPRTRLHDTINRLNGCQTHALIRFHGNGHGTGVKWELR